MSEGSTVYILEAVIEQTCFTDGYGEQAFPNYVIVGVYDDLGKAEAEKSRKEEIEKKVMDESDTDPVTYIIEEFPVQ